LTLEVLEASEPKDIPEQEIVAQVRAVTELAPDTRLLHLQTPRSHRLRFLAGQSLSLGWAGAADDDCRASYAIASCPCDDRNLHFYIPRNARDAFATRLFAGRIKGGASIVTQGPFGDFVLADGHRPLVFVACDTGFAPVKSLIEHAIALDDAPSLTLFWLATRRDGHFLSKHCRAWEQALDQFHYHLSSDNDARSGAQAIARVIGAEPLRSSADYYIAGPAEFVQSIHEQLLGYGLAAEQVFATVIADSGSASHQSSKCADQP
jgi:CDP-4-dehydro-6-deoxyglucose reductase